jgi:hypothetical protein
MAVDWTNALNSVARSWQSFTATANKKTTDFRLSNLKITAAIFEQN